MVKCSLSKAASCRPIVSCFAIKEVLAILAPSFQFDNLTAFTSCKSKKKYTLVSGNAGDEKNLHPGGRKFIFLINFIDFLK